ncbi:hypothetical protein niasHT_008602 [Heterodera trifolii]|uniref:Uncharacterized protein n=1 Tax=Heterodera trifolii TaxID=157864 RepID=A0ABD2M434_9BILA
MPGTVYADGQMSPLRASSSPIINIVEVHPLPTPPSRHGLNEQQQSRAAVPMKPSFSRSKSELPAKALSTAASAINAKNRQNLAHSSVSGDGSVDLNFRMKHQQHSPAVPINSLAKSQSYVTLPTSPPPRFGASSSAGQQKQHFAAMPSSPSYPLPVPSPNTGKMPQFLPMTAKSDFAYPKSSRTANPSSGSPLLGPKPKPLIIVRDSFPLPSPSKSKSASAVDHHHRTEHEQQFLSPIKSKNAAALYHPQPLPLPPNVPSTSSTPNKLGHHHSPAAPTRFGHHHHPSSPKRIGHHHSPQSISKTQPALAHIMAHHSPRLPAGSVLSSTKSLGSHHQRQMPMFAGKKHGHNHQSPHMSPTKLSNGHVSPPQSPSHRLQEIIQRHSQTKDLSGEKVQQQQSPLLQHPSIRALIGLPNSPADDQNPPPPFTPEQHALLMDTVLRPPSGLPFESPRSPPSPLELNEEQRDKLIDAIQGRSQSEDEAEHEGLHPAHRINSAHLEHVLDAIFRKPPGLPFEDDEEDEHSSTNMHHSFAGYETKLFKKDEC